MDIKILQEMGLTENETRVYIALLETGPSLAGVITRKTGIHRRNIYDITERLIEKGLVAYIKKNNRKYFESVDPRKLLDMLKQRENELMEKMPLLSGMYSKTKEKQETNFYRGLEGLKAVFQEQLETKGEILILGASQSAFEVLPFYFRWYDIDRVKKKIRTRIIASNKLGKKIPLSEIRYISQKYANPLAINIYGDKVAIILWKKNPIAIVIKEKEVADSYRKYFELVWTTARVK